MKTFNRKISCAFIILSSCLFIGCAQLDKLNQLSSHFQILNNQFTELNNEMNEMHTDFQDMQQNLEKNQKFDKYKLYKK